MTDLPRRVSGFNLDELLPEKGFNVARALVGTESTCVTVLQARLKLCPGLFERTLVTVAYDTIGDAGDDVPRIVDRFRPIGLEGVDRRLIDDQQELGMNASDLTELPRHDLGRRLAARPVRRRHRRRVGPADAGIHRVAHRRAGLRPGPRCGDEEQAGRRVE